MLRTFIDTPKEGKIIEVSPTTLSLTVSGTITKASGDPDPTFWAAIIVKTQAEIGATPGGAMPQPVPPPGPGQPFRFNGSIIPPSGLNGSDTETLPDNYLAVFAASGTMSSPVWSALADIKTIKGVRLESGPSPPPSPKPKPRDGATKQRTNRKAASKS